MSKENLNKTSGSASKTTAKNVFDDFLSGLSGLNTADLAQKAQPKKAEGRILQGTIIRLDDKYVWVDVGAKEEGRITKDEFMYDGQLMKLNLGDKISVCREQSEDGSGSVFSHSRARKEAVWSDLEQTVNKVNVDAKVVSAAQRGYIVEIMKAPIFLSEKQLDPATQAIKNLVGQTIKVRIIRMDRSRGSILISRKQALELDEDSQLQIGEIVTGVVTEVQSEKAFLKYKDYDLIMQNRDYMWEKTENLEKVLSVGQELRVKVLGYEKAGKTKVGHKQLLTDPWYERIEFAKVAVGDMVSAKVQSIEKSGAFLLLDTKPALLAYMRADEAIWTRRSIIPQEVLQIDKEYTVIITDIDRKKHTIHVSIKRCNTNPLEAFAKKYKVGNELKGKVVEISAAGTIVSLEGGVEGLIPGIESKIDDEITVEIVSINVDEYELILHPNHATNPHEFLAWKHVKQGSVLTGEVTHIDPNTLLIQTKEGVEGVIRKAELQEGQTPEDFTLGQKIRATVIDKDEKQMKVILAELSVL